MLAFLNLASLVLVALYFGWFEERWLVAGVMAGWVCVVGVFLLLQSVLSTTLEQRTALPGSPEILAAGPKPTAPFEVPSDAPMAPSTTVTTSGKWSDIVNRPIGDIMKKLGLPTDGHKQGKVVATIDGPMERPPQLAPPVSPTSPVALPPVTSGPPFSPTIAVGTPLPNPRPPADPRPPKTIATADGTTRVNTAAYWNSWFTDGSGPSANILIENKTYTFTLDVAAFDYALLRRASESSSAKVDKAFEQMIADSKASEVLLSIKPIVPEGSGLRLTENQNFYWMKVDLEKIRRPDADAAGKYANGSITLTELSKQAGAGAIQIRLTAESQGCATIAFAIFRGLQPIDHLVQRVSIGADNTSAPVCDSDKPEQADALSGGLDSLREVSLGMEGSGTTAIAAAALHIFDFDVYSMAVFVDGRPGKEPTAYGWQTASSVVEYLRTDQFQNLILRARRDAAYKKEGNYIQAAKELSKVLFSTKPGNSTENDAKNARAAFRAIVRESKNTPVVVVRVASQVTGGQNRSIYVPLGILGAKGPDPVLEKPIIVVQPMALERYPSRDKCIGDWMFAVPDLLENVSKTVMPPGFFPAKIPGTRISEIKKLREYLALSTAVTYTDAPQLATGFVVLAHQDEGAMWFEESANHIIQQDIERRFPSGSVAIFAACSAASAKGRNAALLQRLNEQGIDTLIASPFTIEASYGVVFASSFAEVIAEVASDKPLPTILELFDKAVARTAQKFKDKADADYSELGLEYVLLGNPAIRLCATP